MSVAPVMNKFHSNVMCGGAASRRPGVVWQRVSTAVWKTLKRIKIEDKSASDCEEIFLTPPESPNCKIQVH